jgi:hypothetical protein
VKGGGFSLALWALTFTSLCACGLDRSGLLDADVAGDDGPFGDEGVVVDQPMVDVDVSAEGGGQNTDAETEVGPNVAPGAPETGAHSDVATDAPLDATVPDASTDAAMEGPRRDAPVDAPTETGPLPIVWDGGAIVDPQFYDSDWINFCVALVACGEMPTVGACVALLHQPSSPDVLIPTPDMVASVNNASPDCKQVRRALGGGLACPSSTADMCNGNSLVTCRLGFTMTIACGDLGMVCSNGSANVGCGFGDCADAQEGQTYCVGPNYLSLCTRGRYEPILDCQTFGGTCTGPAGAAQCRGTGGTTCSGSGSCVGSSLVECMGGLLGGVDCSQLFDPTFTCVVDDAGDPMCAGGSSCDPELMPDTCTPTMQVSFCNVGASAT